LYIAGANVIGGLVCFLLESIFSCDEVPRREMDGSSVMGMAEVLFITEASSLAIKINHETAM
jgi:hypothetical protein